MISSTFFIFFFLFWVIIVNETWKKNVYLIKTSVIKKLFVAVCLFFLIHIKKSRIMSSKSLVSQSIHPSSLFIYLSEHVRKFKIVLFRSIVINNLVRFRIHLRKWHKINQINWFATLPPKSLGKFFSLFMCLCFLHTLIAL